MAQQAQNNPKSTLFVQNHTFKRKTVVMAVFLYDFCRGQKVGLEIVGTHEDLCV